MTNLQVDLRAEAENDGRIVRDVLVVDDLQIGRQMDVLLDSPVPDEENAWIGRSYADAPDVDSVTYVTGERLSVGQIVRCEIVAAKDYDLIAVATPSTNS